MRVRVLLPAILMLALLSCANNVYIDDGEGAEGIWMVGTACFATANDAIAYMMSGDGGRAMAEDEGRTARLTRPVLAPGSDGIVDPSYSKYVEDDSLRGSIAVPATFEGDLCIDFGGHRYDFSNGCGSFFIIEGGDNIYIYNGQSVIFDEASHEPYAIAVNTKTVTIDEHMIDDRRVDNRLLYVGEKGHLVIDSVNPAGSRDAFSGKIAVATDGESGAALDIRNSSMTITDIYTKYRNEDGTVSDEIADSTAIAGNARSRINIYSGSIRIEGINKKSDYYDSATSTLFGKAIINTLGTSGDTTIESAHDIYEAIGKAIGQREGSAAHSVLHSMVRHPRVEATCIANGHIEYWTCDGSDECRSRYYTKEDGTGYETDYSSLELSDPSAHSLEHTEAKAATCTEDGNIEYWHCTICDRYFSDEALTEETTEDDTVIPHHAISSEWEYDIDSHWRLCAVDGNKVDEATHSWGEWKEKRTGSVAQLYAECGACGARKAATRPEYLVYDIGIGEAKLKAIEATPCGDFYINGAKAESGAAIAVEGPSVAAEFRPYYCSNTSYTTTYAGIVSGGRWKETAGETDSDGKYAVSFTLDGRSEHILSIQIGTEGGNIAFECSLYKEN